MNENLEDRLNTAPALSRKLIFAQALAVGAFGAWVLLVRRPLGWPGEWTIDVYGAIYPVQFLAAPALTLAGFAGLIAYLWRLMNNEKIDSHRHALAWTIAVCLSVAAWASQMALWSVAPESVTRLAAIQLSDVSTGYLSEAMQIHDPSRYLRRYAEEMPRKAEHVATHPPGAVLFFYAVRRIGATFPALNRAVLEASSTAVGVTIPELRTDVMRYPTARWHGSEGLATAILASWLLGVAGALMPLVTFAALHRWLGFQRALATAALLALVPGMLLYFATLTQIMMLCSAVMMAVLVATQRHWAWSALAGLVAATALFVSLGALALVGLGGLFLLLRAAKQVGQSGDSSWSKTPSVLLPPAVFGVAVLVGVGLWYVVGVDAIEVFTQGLGAHSEITGLASFRRYRVWAWMNLVEFLIFLGLPFAVLLIASMPRMIRTLRRMSGMMLPAYLGTAAVLTLLMLNFSGVVLGETGRLWMLFAPWLAAGVSPLLIDEEGSHWRLLAITCALTALQLLLMAWTMQPIMRPY